MYYYPLSSLRAATISWGVFRMTLSVSEGTGFRPNRPLADAQGYSPPRNATNGYRFAACRHVGQALAQCLLLRLYKVLVLAKYRLAWGSSSSEQPTDPGSCRGRTGGRRN